MALATPPDQGLPQLGIVFVVEGRVLFVELMQPGGELLLFAPLLDLNGQHREGLRERDLGQHHRRLYRR